jgi:hypothetical protein
MRILRGALSRLAICWVLVLPSALSGCGRSVVEPSGPDCQFNDTGALVFLNQADRMTPRDVYIDGHFSGTLAYGEQMTIDVAAGVVHTIDWVSTLGGGTVNSTRLLVETCTSNPVTTFL